MAVFVSFFLILLAIPAVTSRKVQFQSCPSQKQLGKILSVDITPCEDDPCVFKIGRNETITTRFVPGEVVQNGMIYLYAIKWGMRIPLPLPSKNVCKGYGLTCPLKSGDPVQITVAEEVPEYCPTGSYELEAVLEDQNGDTVVCGIIHLEIA